MLRVAPGATNLLRPSVFGASLLGLVLAGSCARELDEPPPPAGGCTLEECMEPVDTPPAGGLGGASGAGGTGGDAPEPVTLEGVVRQVTSADLLDVTTLGVAVDVIADAAPQGVVRFTTQADGSFLLENARENSALVVAVAPADSDAALQVIQTLQAVDTTTVTETELYALNRDMFADLVEQSFTVNPTAFNPGLAAAIVHFVDTNGDPLDGVSLLEGSPGVVAYDNGAVYSDALEQTGGRGALVLLNLPTTSTLIRFRDDQRESQTRLPDLAPGSITLHTVRP